MKVRPAAARARRGRYRGAERAGASRAWGRKPCQSSSGASRRWRDAERDVGIGREASDRRTFRRSDRACRRAVGGLTPKADQRQSACRRRARRIRQDAAALRHVEQRVFSHFSVNGGAQRSKDRRLRAPRRRRFAAHRRWRWRAASARSPKGCPRATTSPQPAPPVAGGLAAGDDPHRPAFARLGAAARLGLRGVDLVEDFEVEVRRQGSGVTSPAPPPPPSASRLKIPGRSPWRG